MADVLEPGAPSSAIDGRDFGAARTVVVDQRFVRRVLNDSHAIGRRVRSVPAAGAEPDPWYETVGVVRAVPRRLFARTHVCACATRSPNPQPTEPPVRFISRCAPGSDPAVTSRRVQPIVTSLDPAVRLDDGRRLDEVLGETQMTSSLTLYALMSFAVAQRRCEIGIPRPSARPALLVAGIFARAMWQIVGGLAVASASPWCCNSDWASLR